MAPDAKVIVLRGDRVTVEKIVDFVAGHAEGIGAADPVRRLAPPWPAAQETNEVRALAAAAAPRSLVPLADDGTGWAYVAVGDEPDEFVADCVEIKILRRVRSNFVLNRRVVLHAIDATRDFYTGGRVDRHGRRVFFYGDLPRRRTTDGTGVAFGNLGAMRVGARPATGLAALLPRRRTRPAGAPAGRGGGGLAPRCRRVVLHLPTFRELYKEHVGDRYGDADGSSRGRTVATALFGDPNALV